MSLLTKEQQDFVTISKEAHKQLEEYFELYKGRVTPNESHTHRGRLLSIIDDLQARAPKQYTVHELRDWFKNRPLIQDEIDALLHEVVPGENEAWYSVLKFAAHVGALKAEP